MLLEELFKAIDEKDPDRFVSYLSTDCRFRFGNLPEVAGIDRIREFVGVFFESIDSLSHDIEAKWAIPGGLVCHGQVTYTRKDGSTLNVPFANIFQLDNDGIRDYLIFADTSKLYEY